MEPSNFASYKMEREGALVLERAEGFAVYKYVNEGVYIEDIFVAKEFRRSAVAATMADQICEEARTRGVNTLIGSVDVTANGATASLAVLLAYGMSVKAVSGNLILFTKSL